MSQLSGRRRNLDTDRWISYVAFYSVSDDGSIASYASILSDEIGNSSDAPAGEVQVPMGVSADEAVRAAVCHYIDTVPVGPGRPLADPLWALKHVLRGGTL